MEVPSLHQFVDLFAGCGGLSLGFLKAGWRGIFAIEKSPDAFTTYQSNLLEKTIAGEIDWPKWLPQKNMTVEFVLREYMDKIQEIAPKVDLITGGPPCQGFSMAGMRRPTDPRNRLVYRFLDFVQAIEPKFVLLENVDGIKHPFRKGMKVKNKPAPSDKIVRRLRKLGYSSEWITLEANRFGVPQNRSRSFLLAAFSRVFPNASDQIFIDYIEESRKVFLREKGIPPSRFVSVEEAISDLQTTDCNGREKERIECIDFPRYKQIK
jgi:DNA (cytosine-5)-methyltransferase 1